MFSPSVSYVCVHQAVRSQHVGEVLAPASKALVLWAANNNTSTTKPLPPGSPVKSSESGNGDDASRLSLQQQQQKRAEVALAALLPRLNAAERLAAEERDELVDLFEATNMDEDFSEFLGQQKGVGSIGSSSGGGGGSSSNVAFVDTTVSLPQCMGGGLGTVQARRSALLGGIASGGAAAVSIVGTNMNVASSIRDSSGDCVWSLSHSVAAPVAVPALSGTSRALRRQLAKDEDVRRGVSQVVAAQQQHRTRLLARELAVALSTEDYLPGNPLPSPMIPLLPRKSHLSQLSTSQAMPLSLLSTPISSNAHRAGAVGLGWRLCEDFEGTWPARRRIVLRPSSIETNPWDRVLSTALLDATSAHDEEGYDSSSSSGNLESAEAPLDQSFVLDRSPSADSNTVGEPSPQPRQQQHLGPGSPSGSGLSGSGADAEALSNALMQLGYSARASATAAASRTSAPTATGAVAAAGGASEEWGLVGEKADGELEVTDMTPDTSASSSSSSSAPAEDVQTTAAAHTAVAQALHQNEDDDDDEMMTDNNAAAGAGASSGGISISGSAEEAHAGADDTLLPPSVTLPYGPLAGPSAPRVNPSDKTSAVEVIMVTPAALYRGELVLASGQRLCFTPEADPSILTRKAAAANAAGGSRCGTQGSSQDDSSSSSSSSGSASRGTGSESDEGRRWPRRERWHLRLLDGCFLRRFRLRDTVCAVCFGLKRTMSATMPLFNRAPFVLNVDS